jgi:hypothetical protein
LPLSQYQPHFNKQSCYSFLNKDHREEQQG